MPNKRTVSSKRNSRALRKEQTEWNWIAGYSSASCGRDSKLHFSPSAGRPVSPLSVVSELSHTGDICGRQSKFSSVEKSPPHPLAPPPLSSSSEEGHFTSAQRSGRGVLFTSLHFVMNAKLNQRFWPCPESGSSRGFQGYPTTCVRVSSQIPIYNTLVFQLEEVC